MSSQRRLNMICNSTVDEKISKVKVIVKASKNKKLQQKIKINAHITLPQMTQFLLQSNFYFGIQESDQE